MTFLSILNAAGTLVLAAYIISATIGRLAVVNVREVQLRFVAGTLLALCWSGACLAALLGGDTPEWYQPLGLMAIALDLFNTRAAWRNGVPPSIQRAGFLKRNAMRPMRVMQNLKFQDLLAGLALASTVVVAGSGAVDGRGNPLLIFTAHADPIVANPGGALDIVYGLRRVRACSGYVDRFVIEPKSEQVVQRFERQPIGSMRPGGKTTARVRIQLEDLPAGNYVFRATVYSQCPDDVYVQQSPDVPFTVAPTPEVVPTLAAPPPEPVPPVTPADIAPAVATPAPLAVLPIRRAPLAPPARPPQKPEPAAPLPDLGAAVRDANRRMAGEGAR